MWDKYDFSAYSALFNTVDRSIFIRDKIANQVRFIWADKNNRNLEIHNEYRLKKIIFKEIQDKYYKRINDHHLINCTPIPESMADDKFKIIKMRILGNEDKDDDSGSLDTISGFYRAYPRVFRCDKCGDYRVLNDKEWKNFDMKHCRQKGCDGKYSQISIIGFCETCGKIDNVSMRCNKGHGSDYIKLVQDVKDVPSSWYFKCTAPGCDWESRFQIPPCNHVPLWSDEKISEEEPTNFTLINVRRGGIFQSCVKTVVDVPENEDIKDCPYVDEIIIGFYLNRWNDFDLDEEDLWDDLSYYLSLSFGKKAEKRDKYIRRGRYSEEDYKLSDSLKDAIIQIKKTYGEYSISEISDYLLLKGTSFLGNEEYLNLSFNESYSKYGVSKEEYETFKETFGIDNITYIPDIQLISVSYGSITGINKFYNPDFTPHFEPHWGKEKKSIKAYAYPYETEGLMFDLDKLKLANWLYDNYGCEDGPFFNEKEAKKYLFGLDESSEEYKALETLIHSFSHILIKRSSLHTGLNSDSCSEMLFPKTGAFMIYSTSSINIGGFAFLFENSLLNWFDEIKLEISECIFDPSCIVDEGACFSCMFLPEYVCCQFNTNLDRDVFLGSTDRYKKGFWEL